jgi:transcriptional regulator with XRE-family HTH domain
MTGNEIRRWRSINRVKQSALADMVGVSTVAVSKWENDQSKPSKTIAVRLAEVMSGMHEGKLAVEIAFAAPQQQIKSLSRGLNMQLVGISAGFKATWPEMSALIGRDMRPFLLNEALFYTVNSDYINDAIRGDILMLSGVSNRLLAVGSEVPENVRFRWHTMVRHIDGEIVHEMVFEPCAASTPVGFERVLRRSDLTANYE